MQIDPDVQDILARSTTAGIALFLPPGQMDRRLYLRVDAALQAAGGRWNRGRKAHVFDGAAAEAIAPILAVGSILHPQKDLELFETTGEALDLLIAAADLRPGLRVLEPSAGKGAIVEALLKAGCFVDAVEQHRPFAEAMRGRSSRDLHLVVGDFLTQDPRARPVDRVVMNPPFSADIRHVRHAWGFLRPGGRIAAIMSLGVSFRQDAVCWDFREWVKAMGGTIAPMPERAFRSAGTDVRTVILTLDKPR